MNCIVTRCQSMCKKHNINLLKYVFIDKYRKVWNSHKRHLAGTIRLLIDNYSVTNRIMLNNLLLKDNKSYLILYVAEYRQ